MRDRAAPLDTGGGAVCNLFIMSRWVIRTSMFLWLGVFQAAADPDCGGMAEPLHLTWVIEYHASMPDAEYEELRLRVSNRPEHPGRRSFEFETRRRVSGPDRVRHELWAQNGEIIRYNTSNTADSLYADYATVDGVVWSMTPEQLTILPADRASGGPGVPPLQDQLDEAAQYLSWFLTRGRSIRDSLPIGPWEEQDGRTVAMGNGIRLVLESTGSPPRTVIRLVECEPDPGSIGLSWSFEGRIAIDGSVCVVPKSISEFTPSGLLDKRVVIESASVSDPATTRLVRRIPPIEGEDAVRGAVTFVAMTDYRKRDPSITVRTESGWSTVAESQTPGRKADRFLRITGWVTAGSLVLAIAILRWRRMT